MLIIAIGIIFLTASLSIPIGYIITEMEGE